MLVSKYGFGDFIGVDQVSTDPSRVAAQVVSGIGFIGGGLIFVRRDLVRGLTTAATVWGTAAAGRRRDRGALPGQDGRGVLRTVLAVCTDNGWSVEGVAVDRESVTDEGHRVATVSLRLGRRRDLGSLAAEVAQLPDVRAVRTGVDDEIDEQ